MTRRHVRTLAVALAALALLMGGGVALSGAASPTITSVSPVEGAQSTVDSCTTIDEPGTYVLTADVDNGGGTAISQACIEITADGVTFDGNGHTIDGRGVSHTKGVAVVNAQNVTVTNFEVTDWHSGVLVENGSATVRDVHTVSNAYGVRLENASPSTVADNTVESNLVGIDADGERVTLDGNDFSNNEVPVTQSETSEGRLTAGLTNSARLVATPS
jgi:parallel beta-helix repeat protein